MFSTLSRVSKRIGCPLLVGFLVVSYSGESGAAAAEKADLVFTGAKVYTVDKNRSWASAVGVSDGRIVYVGSDKGAQAWIGSNTNVVDIAGRTILPGFHDAHIHIKMGGAQLEYLDLSPARSRPDILNMLKEYATAHPEKAWVVGVNFPLHVFPDANPRKEDLDGIVSDRPVYLIESEAHSAWMNSKALQLAGIAKDTQDPKGAKIERAAETGEPSGTIREPFQFGIDKFYTKAGLFPALADIRRALVSASEAGITSVMDPLVSSEEQSYYRVADAMGYLNARVTLALWVDPTKGPSQIKDIIKHSHKDANHRLSTTAAKFILDGVLTSKTGYLIDPYQGDQGNRGTPIFSTKELEEMVAELDKNDISAQLHAVGDGAVRQGLDAVGYARKKNGFRDTRHQIIHLDVVNPEDYPRFSKVGANVNIQPYWGYYSEYVKASEALLSEGRRSWIYPYRSLAKSLVGSRARMMAGSDWPITTLNPLYGMQVAITRKGVEDAGNAPAFLPDEALDLETMIRMYTIDGAYALGQERVTGSIERGKYADMIVLDKNPFEVPAEDLHKVKVLMTLVGGKAVFIRDDAF